MTDGQTGQRGSSATDRLRSLAGGRRIAAAPQETDWQDADEAEARDAAEAYDAYDAEEAEPADPVAATPRRRRWLAYGLIGVVALIVALVGGAALLVNLDAPISLDFANGWVARAIEENFGGKKTVQIGGSQIERDENGHLALRIRDIVVRDPDGAVVASAPKANVGFSGGSILLGRMHAERLELVEAEMAVRIEQDGEVTVFAGGQSKPLASAPATTPKPDAVIRGITGPATQSALATTPVLSHLPTALAALFNWIDGVRETGLDGYELRRLGLRNGKLTVDDRRNGKRWDFAQIDLALARTGSGGVEFSIESRNASRPWGLRAEIGGKGAGRRSIALESDRVSTKDVLLALRVPDGPYEPDLPVSMRLRAEVADDGQPLMATGRIVAGQGTVIDRVTPSASIAVDRAQVAIDWDATRQMISAPFELVSGANHFSATLQVAVPAGQSTVWTGVVGSGYAVLGADSGPGQLVMNRVGMQWTYDSATKRFGFEKGEFGNDKVGVAFSGALDLIPGDARIAAGLAATPMSVGVLKKIWPAPWASGVREWVLDHFEQGQISRYQVAVKAPVATLLSGGPPIPDDGLLIEAEGSGIMVRPVALLPAIKDADMRIKVTGRTALVNLAKGAVDMPSGRKLLIPDGSFEIADTQQAVPSARVKFRAQGEAAAAAELLAMDRLKEFSGAPVDPATSKGTIAAQIALTLPVKPNLAPGETDYALTVDLNGFSADKMVLGQKLEANTLKITANTQGYQIRGDVRIGGVPGTLDYRKPRGDGDAEVRLAATLDDATRIKLGIDPGPSLTGAVPVKLSGRVGAGDDRETRLNVEADLTAARIDNLLPGWTKPAGRAGRAVFALVKRNGATRFEDITIDSSGALIKGTMELDANGDLTSANFPSYVPSEGDRAMLRADRAPDGTLKILMRGDVFDGRSFIKSTFSTSTAPGDNKPKRSIGDFDAEVKLGVVAGHRGEALRALDLRVSRRAGVIRSFSLSGKLGRDTPVSGDLRGGGGGRDILYFETADAGALLRFTDTYARINGGQMWVTVDPPSADGTAVQNGLVNVRNFSIRGEQELERVLQGGPNAQQVQRVDFTQLSLEFTKQPNRLVIREGVVRGPMLGATIDGEINFLRDAMALRGTLVPLYGINNIFGQLPVLGLILGNGNKEGLLGITYEVVGQPSQPQLRVNPISLVTPGLLRKVFEFQNLPQQTPPTSFAPQR